MQKTEIKKPKIICIGGPTGVGKTALAIKLANLFDGEIISCDSIAIYKHLNIGSAKPDKTEQAMAKHYMIDIKNPDEQFDMAEYRAMAKDLIKDILSRGKLPIIVGGTGLYMKGLLFPLELGNAQKSEQIREKYQMIAAEQGGEKLLELLNKVDPESASKLHPKDTLRIIRALEIFELTGQKKSSIKTELVSEYDYMLIFLNDVRAELYKRIDQRVDKMLEAGLENEVKNLIKDYSLTAQNQSMQGIGYKEFFEYFDNKLSNVQLADAIKQNSRHYAKRQITWFKAMPNVCEYNYKDKNVILNDIKTFLKR